MLRSKSSNTIYISENQSPRPITQPNITIRISLIISKKIPTNDVSPFKKWLKNIAQIGISNRTPISIRNAT